jgi:YD repeat-containing protein
MINPLGQRSSNVLDAAGRSIASINPLGQRSSNVLDAAGQLMATINPLGQRSFNVLVSLLTLSAMNSRCLLY